MNPNLEKTYDEVVSVVLSYRDYEGHLMSLTITWWMRPRQVWRRWWALMQIEPDFLKHLSRKRSERYRTVLMEVASEEQQKHPFFKIASSNYPTHGLVSYLIAHFTSEDINSALAMHALRGAFLQRSALAIKAILGYVLAIGTIILQLVPEPVVVELGLEYSEFETKVFFITLGVLAYLGLAVVLPWFRMSVTTRLKHIYVGDVLEYACLLIKHNSA